LINLINHQELLFLPIHKSQCTVQMMNSRTVDVLLVTVLVCLLSSMQVTNTCTFHVCLLQLKSAYTKIMVAMIMSLITSIRSLQTVQKYKSQILKYKVV